MQAHINYIPSDSGTIINLSIVAENKVKAGFITANAWHKDIVVIGVQLRSNGSARVQYTFSWADSTDTKRQRFVSDWFGMYNTQTPKIITE